MVNVGTTFYAFTTNTATVAGNNITIYADGILNQATLDVGNLPYAGDSGKPITVGARSSTGGTTTYYPGSITVIQVYNRNLTAQEVKQNCLAQERRFTNTPTSICSSP
jgi:hypothetical protein